VRAADHARNRALGAAELLVRLLTELDRSARREHRTVPRLEEHRTLHAEFWHRLVPALATAERHLDAASLLELRGDVQALLHPLLCRSSFWNRSWLKPHGFPGDFRMIESMYDLEDNGGADPTQPALVNLLDHLFRSAQSVHAMWHRRAWFADLIAARLEGTRARSSVRVLDVACGGSRLVRDVVGRHGPFAVEATFFDQDPAALAFLETWLPAPTRINSKMICGPVRRLGELLPPHFGGQQAAYDIVIAAGLFDYLIDAHARELLEHMIAQASPGGTVAICNFGPDDRSRVVKEWISDWPLIYRSRAQLLRLFPRGLAPSISESPDGGLLYARVDL
jgi:SAM-dependent methyltransferase